jgi:hypothetical protein
MLFKRIASLLLTAVCLVGPSEIYAGLSGSYLVGSGGLYANLSQALSALSSEGMEGDVYLKVTSSVQVGPFVIGNVQGQSEFDLQIGPSGISVVTLVTTDTTQPILTMSGAENVHLHGFSMTSPAVSQPALRISNGSRNNSVSGSWLLGRSTGRIVEITGTGSDYNLIKDCTLRRGGEGVHMDGGSPSGYGNSIVRCAIDSVSQGVVVYRQSNCTIENNTILTNAGSAGSSNAISVGTQAAIDSVFVTGNTISDVTAGSGYAVAIRHNPLSSYSYLRASNNFIFGFRNTGSSQVRAVYLSGGENRIVNNSILVNDVSATGTAYCVYNGLLAPENKLSLKNNILVNLEATRTAYCIFNLTAAANLESDNNLFYGIGEAYSLGYLIQPLHSLPVWQSNTGLDAHAREGNPQFVSDTDLHLLSTSELAHQNGAVALDVPRDRDNQTRFQPPDIGADEYDYDAPTRDVAILGVIGLPPSFPEHSLLRLEVVVQNRGSAAVNNLPLRLSYGDTARAEVIVSLAPSVSDTTLLLWSTGEIHPNASLTVEAMLPLDANPEDNGRSFTLAVTGQPLSGTYRVGGPGADFQSITSAAEALNSRGVSDDVILYVADGLYSETLQLNSVGGLSSDATLLIRPVPEAEGIVMLSPSNAEQVIGLTNVSYVTIEGLIVRGDGTGQNVVSLTGDSHNNTLRNCQISGGSQSQSSASGVFAGPGCYGNRFQNLEISSAYNGIRLEGSSTSGDAGNHIVGSTINNVRVGVFAMWQRDMLVETCEISVEENSVSYPCYGIRVGNMRGGDTVQIVNNSISRCISSGTLYGLSCESGSGTVQVVNNRIGQFDAQTSGQVNAISVQSGQADIYHNTIHIGDLSSQQVTGIVISGHQTVVNLLNNIVSVDEPVATARFIEWSGGDITSNHNLYDAPGSNTQFRFARSSLDNEYASLSSWTESTGQDSSSLTSIAGFISSEDLHIRPDAAGPSDRGLFLPDFAIDIDGNLRGATPDIGADEYDFIGAITDLEVASIELPVAPLLAATSYDMLSIVRNVGQHPVNNAIVRLCYNLVPVDSQIVSLSAGELLDVYWTWVSPPVDLAFGSLRVVVAAAGDAVDDNDYVDQSIVVAGSPLSGTVTVAPEGAEYSSLSALLENLKWRGISEQTTVLLSEGNYEGPFRFSGVLGADSVRRLVVIPESGANVTLSAANATAVVEFLNTDFVRLQGLTIECGENTPVGLMLDGLSCSNEINSCTIAGPGASVINSIGIKLSGAECHGNGIEGSAISACYTGIQLSGDPVNLSRDNFAKSNSIEDVYYGVWVDHQQNARVIDNDIRPGTVNGPAGACYGVYVLQLGTTGSVRVEGNRIHDFVDTPGPRTNRASGIYSAPGISSTVEIVNNFIYGFSNLSTLRTRAIYLSSGSHLVAFNNIRMDDSPADNETAGIFVSTGTQHELYNNCIMGYENDVNSYALDIEAGANVVSDYNCFWGNSSLFRYAGVGAQDYEELSSFMAAGQDAHSYELHARYVSATDLHMQVTDSTMYSRGVYLQNVSSDVDGDLRRDPPCIGADEYVYQLTLDAPQDLTIYTSDGTSVTLSWQPVTAATGYYVYGAATLDELENSPSELGHTAETTWIWDISSVPENIRFFVVRAE